MSMDNAFGAVVYIMTQYVFTSDLICFETETFISSSTEHLIHVQGIAETEYAFIYVNNKTTLLLH